MAQGVEPSAHRAKPAGGDELPGMPVHQPGRGQRVPAGEGVPDRVLRLTALARTSRRRARARGTPPRARVGAARTGASRRPGGGSDTTRRAGPAARRTGCGARPRPAGWPSRCGPARGRTASRTSARARRCAAGTARSPGTPGRAARPGSSPTMNGSSPASPLARARRRPARRGWRARPGRPRPASPRCAGPGRAPPSSEQLTPASVRTARASSSVNARSSGPNSTHRPSLRSRPSLSASRDPIAMWNPGGRPAASARTKFTASTLRSS